MSCEANTKFLSHLFTSKEHFTTEYRKLCTSKELYLSSLTQLHETIVEDNINGFQQISTLISYITEEEKQHTLRTYYEDEDNPIRRTNLVILACKYNRVKILKGMFDSNRILDNLTVGIGRSAITGDDIDGECHNAFYYAIRSRNIELLDDLIRICTENYFADPATELDDILSRTYEELKLKKVPLSNQMEVFVESKLIDIRFYSNDNGQYSIPTDDIETIKSRIQITLENILLLNVEYSNSEVDAKFLFIVKFIVQNIFVLKRQLKSTYDRLPWEELEFCLVCFSSLYTKPRDALNLFYKATLSKGRMLTHLFNFATQLQRLNCFVKSTQISKLAILPNLKRDEVVERITQLHPDFESLYSDYQQVRDVCSLQKISDYIILSLSVDCKTEEGQLTLTRVLQVIGEFLKNSLESPKMSKTTSELLVLLLPKNTKEVIIALRNSLSHASSLAQMTEIEKMADVNYFSGIQNDIKKIGDVIADILCKNKIKTIRCLLEKIVDCENLAQIRQFAEVLCTTEFEKLINIKLKSSEQEKLEKLIQELSANVTNKTAFERKLFKRINDIISSVKSKVVRYDYVRGRVSIEKLKSFLEESNIGPNEIRGLKFIAKETLKSFATQVPFQSLKEIGELSLQIFSSFEFREQRDSYDNISRVICEILYLAEFRADEIKEIKKLREKLKNKFPTKKRRLISVKHVETYNDQLLQKISTLKNVLLNNKVTDQLIEKHSSYKRNNKLQAVIEMLVLDIISIFGATKDLLEDIRFFCDDSSSLLIGKSLRNHLAHDNALINVLLSDPTIAILVNANKLANENAITTKIKKIGKVMTDDPIKLKERFFQGLSTIINQEQLFAAVEKGNLEDFKNCMKKGGDLKATDINSWTTLHFAAKGARLEMLEFIYKCNINASIKDINGESPLHIAAVYGRTDILVYLIRTAGCDVNDVNNNGKTPLHIAAQHGHCDAIEVLLQMKAKLTAKDKYKLPPLYSALKFNQVDAAFVLLKNYDSDQINEAENGHTPLHFAAEKGQLSLVKYLLQNKANVNVKSERGYTPLHAAALNGHVKTVEALILSGAKVQAKDKGGCTPLHYSVENGHELIADFLLRNGASVNVVDINYKNTPLHYAAMDGFDAILKILLKFKGDPNLRTSEGMTPIHLAAYNGHLGIVLALLEHGVDVNIKNINQCTPLHLAAQCGHKDIVQLLIKYKVKVNATSIDNVTALHLCSAEGHRDVVDLLLKSKAKIRVQNIEGDTPLHYAAQNGFVNVIELLTINGADVDARNCNGLSALHFAAAKSHKDAVACLIRNRARVNAKTNSGLTPLHAATFEGCTNIAELLIENQAEVNSRDAEGITPLQSAVSYGQKEVAEILLRNGADVHSKLYGTKSILFIAVGFNYKELVQVLIAHGVNVNENNGDALMSAVVKGYAEIVDILLRNGAGIFVEDNSKMTLLHFAASSGHKEIVNALIAKGAVVDAVTIAKYTPLHIAALMGHDDIVEFLIAKGANSNAKCCKANSALHIAVANGDASVVQVLLENKCNVNLKDGKNRTALELAVANGHLKIVKMIMSFVKFGINNNSNEDWPLLHIASQNNNLQMVRYLVNVGADIHARNSLGSKAIHIAAREGHTNTVEFFLSLGLSVDEVGAAEQTLLHYAVSYGSLNTSTFLILQGADVNAEDMNGETPLHLATILGHIDIVDILLENGAVYNVVDVRNNAPYEHSFSTKVITLQTSTVRLFDSVRRGSLSDVECCVKAGTPVNAIDAFSFTPLHYAVNNGHVGVVNLLLENGADVFQVTKKGNTPLHTAVSRNDPNVVDILLKHVGRDKRDSFVNAKTTAGGTSSLHVAAKNGCVEIVKTLLKHGAIYCIKNNESKTPLDVSKNEHITAFLGLIEELFRDSRQGSDQVIRQLRLLQSGDLLSVTNARCNLGNTLLQVALINQHKSIANEIVTELLKRN